MGYSDEQIKSYAYQLQAKGAPMNVIETFVREAKAGQTASTVSASPTSQMSDQQFNIPYVDTGSTAANIPVNAGIGLINAGENFGVGIGSDIGSSLLNAAKLPVKAVGAVADSIIPGASKYTDKVVGGIESLRKGVYEDPYAQNLNTVPGMAGKLTGEAATFAAPGGAIVKGQKALEGLDLVQKSPWIVQKLAQVAPEVVGTGATQYAKSGGDTSSAESAGVVAGILSALTHVSADAFAKIVPQDAKQNLEKFLSYKGKQTLSGLTTDKKMVDGLKAMTSMLNFGKGMEVLDSNSVKKTWDPNNTSLHEAAQVFRGVKDKLYTMYDSLAEKAGDTGARFTQKDIGPIIDKLDETIKTRGTPFANKAKEIKGDILRIFGEKTPQGMAPIKPVAIQNFLQDMSHFVQSEPKSPAAKVVAETADQLREALDTKISNATGESYSSLKNAYKQMKTLEPDLVKQLAKIKNQSGLGLADVVDGLSAIDMIQGVATLNPNLVARAFAIGSVKAYKQFSKNPEFAFLRALKALNTGNEAAAPSTLSQRFLGARTGAGGAASTMTSTQK